MFSSAAMPVPVHDAVALPLRYTASAVPFFTNAICVQEFVGIASPVETQAQLAGDALLSAYCSTPLRMLSV